MNSKINKNKLTITASVGILAIAVSMAAMFMACDVSSGKDNNNYNKQQPPAIAEEKPEVTEGSDVKQKNNQDTIMNEYKALLANSAPLTEVVKFIDKNISLVSKENVTVILNGFEEMQKKYLPKLDEKFYSDVAIQNKIMKVYKPGFDLNKIGEIEDAELKELLIETRDCGYKVETAEGMFFPVLNYEFYKKYSAYAAEDIKEYIDLMAVESNNMPANDAALVIKWDELLKRALNQEKFIAQNGSSVKIDEVKQLYKKYLTFTLLGLNNTPLFSYDSKVMAPEAKKAYMELVEGSNNSDSEFLKIVSNYMELIKKSNYKLTDEIDNYRNDILKTLK